MNVNLGDYYAYSGRFADAARNYQHAGAPERAMTMFSDLRMFDQAKVDLILIVSFFRYVSFLI